MLTGSIGMLPSASVGSGNLPGASKDKGTAEAFSSSVCSLRFSSAASSCRLLRRLRLSRCCPLARVRLFLPSVAPQACTSRCTVRPLTSPARTRPTRSHRCGRMGPRAWLLRIIEAKRLPARGLICAPTGRPSALTVVSPPLPLHQSRSTSLRQVLSAAMLLRYSFGEEKAAARYARARERP